MRKRLKKVVIEEFYRMRTQGLGRGRQALALGIGVFIGATPLWGIHFLFCLVAARALRLNPVIMYGGAQVSYPVFAPFLYFGEVQVGRLLREGAFYSMSLAQFRQLSPLTFAVDLLIGSVVLGVVLAVLMGGSLFLVLSRRTHAPDRIRIAAAVARRYFPHGIAAWEYAWAKLKWDPVYFALLDRGSLPDQGLVLDLGCGRGLLFSLLAEAEELVRSGGWPAAWRRPPGGLQLHGIEVRERPAAIARRALGERAVIQLGDIRTARLPAAQAVTLLDVLHYLARDEQEILLLRAAKALPIGGALLIREGDAAGGARFWLTWIAEHFMCWLRGSFSQRFAFRSAAEWRELLQRVGFDAQVSPMAQGTPFANVFVTARRTGSARLPAEDAAVSGELESA